MVKKMSRWLWLVFFVCTVGYGEVKPSLASQCVWPQLVLITLQPLEDENLKNKISLVVDNSKTAKSYEIKGGYPSFYFEKPDEQFIREYYLKYIRRIDRDGKFWKVTLTSGKSFKAWWLSEPTIYHYEDSGVASFCYQSANNKGKKLIITTAGINSLKIKTPTKWVSEFSKQVLVVCKNIGSVVVVLKNGKSLVARKVFLHDFEGRWGGTSTLTRWLNAKEIYGGCSAATLDEDTHASAEGIQVSGNVLDPLKVKKITLTGRFSKRWLACREVVIEYRNGKTKKTNLLLSSESRGGIDFSTDIIGRDLDAVGGLTDYGAWYVPLNNVKSIYYQP